MPSASDELIEDNRHCVEEYTEIDDDEAADNYPALMETTQKFDFNKTDSMKKFETEYEKYFAYKSQTHGTFLHYWANAPPTESPPPNFGKWLFSKRPGMIKEVDKDDRTPIHVALDRKFADAQNFLRTVADEWKGLTLVEALATRDGRGNNCLHHAIFRNSPWTQELIKACLSPSEKHLFTTGNKEEQTPLHLAMVPARQKPPSTLLRRPLVDMKKAAQADTRRMSISKDKEQKGPHQSEKPEVKDKERGKDFNGVNKGEVASEAITSKNRTGTTKETTRPVPSGLEQRPNDLSNNGSRVESSTTTFVVQDVVQDLMEYGKEALWKLNINNKTPYQYRLELLSKRKNGVVQEDAMNRQLSEDLVARIMKEFCLRNLRRGDAIRSLYEKGKDLERLARHLIFEDTLQYVAIPRLRVEDPAVGKPQPLASQTPGYQNEPKEPNQSQEFEASNRLKVSKESQGVNESKDSKPDSKVYLTRDASGLKSAGVIFKWLAERKVSRIFKVIVIDDGKPPHSNQAIEESLKGFKIETWDWKKVDICSDTILEAASGVRILNLYASGNSAVLKGWSCTDGLVKLKNLERIKLVIRPGFETELRLREDVDKFTTDFKENWSKKYKKNGPDPDIVWDDKETSLTSWIQSDRAPDEKQRWLEHMDTFADFINNIDLEREKKERSDLQAREGPGTPVGKRTKQLEDVKVAIIDDGVDGFDPTVSKSITNGVSFCRGSSDLVKSYYVSSGGHGTNMARLILRMCPTAKLYVARLQEYTSATGKRFITAESATDAIRWAITNGVQIISMSWTIEGNKNEPRIINLKKAIDDALVAKITIFCAFSDQGVSAPADSTFPTAWKEECCRIGAATAAGDASTLVPKSQVDFLFPGENIVIDAEPSLSSLSRKAESGSSFSTALAAGTAAMLLFITQLISATLYEKLRNPKTMRSAFERLGSKNNPQYFDALKFSQQFARPEWAWDQIDYRTGKGWDEVKKLVEQL
ncbi:hypothetical protein V494_00369 [Pseudogymnoascus sp. VKM F-4513 (FW-928)]|nr:hypothetical protein V494_00369 [Pseudogymnoascus sp. VKM F-4513 (FW-928)]